MSSIPSGSDANTLADTRLLCAFFALVYFLQSVGDPSSGVIAQPLRSLLRGWDQSAAEIALFMAILSLPWSVKPLFGLISDYLPIYGSKRKIYLILSSTCAALGFAGVAGSTWVEADLSILLALLMLPALGVAFSDVLIDGIMIDKGRPRGLTGMFQSVQWTAGYAGMLLAGAAGGYLSQLGQPGIAFSACALFWSLTLLLALVLTEERSHARSDAAPTLRGLLALARDTQFLSLSAFLFIWNINPLWTTVLYVHLTEAAGLDELAFGTMISTFSFGCLVASALYPLYCQRLTLRTLFSISIVTGAVANLLYLLSGIAGLLHPIALLGGLAYMTGTMIQMDIAARRVPLAAAATLFALLMALSNLGSSVGEAAGGHLYELLRVSATPAVAYGVVVIASALIPLLCLPLASRVAAEPRMRQSLASTSPS